MTAFRVLVIDDSMVARRQTQLALSDYSVDVGASAAAGFELARTTCPDVILLDDIMPGVSLDSCLIELQSDPLLNTIPVIILTDNSDFELTPIQQQFPAAVSVLVKPLVKDKIIDAVLTAVAIKIQQTESSPVPPEEVERVSDIITKHFAKRLEQIPQWEATREENEPGQYYRSRLMPAPVLRLLATQLCATQPKAAPAPVTQNAIVVWDQDHNGVAKPLIDWLERRYHIRGWNLNETPEPLAELTRDKPKFLVCSAETIGLDATLNVIQQVVASCPETKIVVTCEAVPKSYHTEWQNAGVTAVLTKPFPLVEIESLIS